MVVVDDRALLDGFPGDPAAFAVVSASVALADALSIGTVAEGIEHDAQRDALAALRCTYGQGFGLARRMAAPQATQFLLAARPPSVRRRPRLILSGEAAPATHQGSGDL